MKISSEYDSEEQVFVNKASLRVLDGLAKIKASCQTTLQGQWCYPLLSLVTRYFTVDYDVDGSNCLVSANADVRQLSFSYRRDIKGQKSSVSTVLRSSDGASSAEVILDSDYAKFLPSAMAKATVLFPGGELRYVDESCEYEESKGLSASVSARMLQGVGMATFSQAEGAINLRYHHKSDSITVVPSLSWPSNQLQLTFKRRFSPEHKLSLTYEAQDLNYSGVYKYTPQDHVKAKVGYDKGAGIAWASLWLGNESEGCSDSPLKTKAQVMVQVPTEEGLAGTMLLFKIKKRVDLL